MIAGAVFFMAIVIIIAVAIAHGFTERDKAVREKAAIAAASRYYKLDKSSGTLFISGRKKAFSKIIVIRPYKLYEDAYKPKQLVYTGVTIGSFTTGSFHEEGGYRYTVGSKSTDKYFMTVLDKGDEVAFNRIQLTDELYEQAIKSSIKQYLNPNTKQIEITGTYVQSAGTSAAVKAGNTTAYEYSVSRDVVSAMPTYEKCKAIANWVCNIS